MLRAMRVPRLLRRRELLLPTLWGWALLVACAAGSGWLGLHTLYGFLAPNEPVGHGFLVVEGWINDDGLAEAIRLWHAGAYTRIVTTGGPIERYASLYPQDNYAEQAAVYLRAHGVEDRDIAVVPAPASSRERTFVAAVALREWIAAGGSGERAFDVLSEGPHARRTWNLYRRAFGDGLEIGIRSVAPALYSPDAWWETSAGTKEVLTEAIAWAWVACFFDPPPRGSREEISARGQDSLARLHVVSR